MNGRNLNVRYRRNEYAKKRNKLILIIVSVVLVLLLAGFLIVGSLLKGKVDDDRQNAANDTVQNEQPEVPHANVGAVKGYGISLSGVTTTKISDKATEIQRAGGSNMSFVARDSSGKETYSSSLARSMGKQSQTDLIDVSEINSRAANKGLTASAIVPVTAFSKKDDLERATQLFYDASVCAELYREGADDVLLKLEATEITESNLEELLRFSDWVKSLDNEVTIGIALTPAVLEKESAEVIIGKLWERYDFLALDLTAAKPWESSDAGNNEIQFYLLMYNMRVLLPDATGTELSVMTDYLKGMGVENYQTVAP